MWCPVTWSYDPTWLASNRSKSKVPSGRSNKCIFSPRGSNHPSALIRDIHLSAGGEFFSFFNLIALSAYIWLPYWRFNMENSIGAVMDDFSAKGCTFFIPSGNFLGWVGGHVLRKWWNMRFFFIFFLLIISLSTAPASPICSQSKLASRWIFCITASGGWSLFIQ